MTTQKLKVNFAVVPEIVPVGMMPENVFGVAIDGQFAGELFMRNVAGIHGLQGNRYWPSEYMGAVSKNNHAYTPVFNVRLLAKGDVIEVE
jgi:hypothetical protein